MATNQDNSDALQKELEAAKTEFSHYYPELSAQREYLVELVKEKNRSENETEKNNLTQQIQELQSKIENAINHLDHPTPLVHLLHHIDLLEKEINEKNKKLNEQEMLNDIKNKSKLSDEIAAYEGLVKKSESILEVFKHLGEIAKDFVSDLLKPIDFLIKGAQSAWEIYKTYYDKSIKQRHTRIGAALVTIGFAAAGLVITMVALAGVAVSPIIAPMIGVAAAIVGWYKETYIYSKTSDTIGITTTDLTLKQNELKGAIKSLEISNPSIKEINQQIEQLNSDLAKLKKQLPQIESAYNSEETLEASSQYSRLLKDIKSKEKSIRELTTRKTAIVNRDPKVIRINSQIKRIQSSLNTHVTSKDKSKTKVFTNTTSLVASGLILAGVIITGALAWPLGLAGALILGLNAAYSAKQKYDERRSERLLLASANSLSIPTGSSPEIATNRLASPKGENVIKPANQSKFTSSETILFEKIAEDKIGVKNKTPAVRDEVRREITSSIHDLEVKTKKVSSQQPSTNVVKKKDIVQQVPQIKEDDDSKEGEGEGIHFTKK